MKITFLLLMIFSFFAVSAQIQRVNVSGSANFALTITPQQDRTVLGSPYLNPEYMFGKVEIENEPTIETLLRYNVYNKELEMIYHGDTITVIKPFLLKYFILNNRTFVYSLCISENSDQEFVSADYFEVLSAGRMQLLANHYSEIETNSYATNYCGGGGDGRNYFVHKTSLYYRNGDTGAARKLQKKKKQILNLMGERKQEVVQYIREARLILRRDEDLVQLFDFYNKLNT
jgi:hypothetical protein